MMRVITYFIPFIWSPPNTCCLRINKKEEYNKIRDNIKDF